MHEYMSVFRCEYTDVCLDTALCVCVCVRVTIKRLCHAPRQVSGFLSHPGDPPGSEPLDPRLATLVRTT